MPEAERRVEREMTIAITLALLIAALLGFLIGLFSFKIKSSWCRECGTTLNCPACTSAGVHRLLGPGR